MSSEYIPLEVQAEILKRLPVIPLLRFRSVSKTWKRLIDSPFFRSFHKAFISPPTSIVSYEWSDKHIPVEIQSEILKRLPIKPLMRFRSVSKSFKCLIDSRYFIACYSVPHPHPLRFTTPTRQFIRKVFPFPTVCHPPYWYNSYSYVVDISHGLLCFKSIIDVDCDSDDSYDDSSDDSYDDDYEEMVVLWNHSIWKAVCIRLPHTNKNYRMVDDVIGFGVCPGTFDPTILKIRCIGYKLNTKDMSGISFPWRVQVFTLSTGIWSVLSTGLPRESIRLRGSQVVIDRFIYWVAYDYMLDDEDSRSQSPFLIMSFDLIAKQFKEINLTGSLTNKLCSIQTISRLHDSLVLLEYHREFKGDPSVCCLWMMTKEQGVNISFTKLFNINVAHAKVNKLLGFRKTGEPILETQLDGQKAQVELYYPNSEFSSKLGIYVEDYDFFMCSYLETLLLLDDRHDFSHIFG